MASSTSPHDATASALGYLYQAKWALLELLRGARERPDGAVSLELHDDVAREEAGRPVDLNRSGFGGDSNTCRDSSHGTTLLLSA